MRPACGVRAFPPGLLALPLALSFALLAIAAPAAPRQARDLRLVPFPKQVALAPGEFRLGPDLALAISGGEALEQAAADLRSALGSFAGVRPPLSVVPAPGGPWLVSLAAPGRTLPVPDRLPQQPEGYALEVRPQGVVVAARSAAGLRWGLQTLRQLVIANLQGGALPCLRIRDSPSLAWRGYQDDITRGRSSLLSTLEREVRSSSLLKLNFFTYYLEHQYAFARHPAIGPAGGSLTPAELRALVAYGRRYGTPIIGCQQSFGHFYHILKHEQYAALREGSDCLDPTNEGTYQLLAQMYEEQIPLLDTPFFNVCCDETVELGTGPARALAERLGVGGVYARHLQRVHDLVTGRYGKRMMMWGDIILQHPDHLAEIPPDTIMLSWGYHAADSFEPAIAPFVQAGFDFFVCPGVSNWGRILPDYATSVANISQYVRDGARLGAMGMLNTSWVDDGESLAGCNWYGLAWGAECAWNGSTTQVGDFNRRLGAVLFGERGQHFGRAIALLSRAHPLPGYGMMFNNRFWQGDGAELPVDRAAARAQARALLAVVEPALAELAAARREARLNAQQIDYTICGAERMRLLATRGLDLLEAGEAYERAEQLGRGPATLGQVRHALALVRGIRARHLALKEQYRRLWLAENRPYALDWVLGRYDALIARYDGTLAGLEQAAAAAARGLPLPDPAAFGLRLVERGVRVSRPTTVRPEPLRPEAAWTLPAYRRRLGFTVAAGDRDRVDQPLQLDLPAGVGGPLALMELGPAGRQQPVPAQLVRDDGCPQLALLLPGPLPGGQQRSFLLYHAPAGKPPAGPAALACRPLPGGSMRLENRQLRLLVGREGGHLYRWEVKALGGRDLTQPGDTDWAGFADLNGAYRRAPNRLQVLSCGPALVRLRCTDPSGLTKTFSLWQGVPWVEVALSSPSPWLANYDDLAVMSAQSATPGQYLFSDGATGPLRPLTATPDCQARRDQVTWGAKYVPGGPLLALITPEVATSHLVGPGSGMGGPCTDNATPTAHFVIYGGRCPDAPREMLAALQAALDYRHPPLVTVYAVQAAGR